MWNDLIKKIKEYEEIILYRHKNPDLDAIGSQAGFFYILKESFPYKNFYIADENDLEYFKKWNLPTSKVESSKISSCLAIVLDVANYERIAGNNIGNVSEIFKIDHHPNDTPYGDFEIVDINYSATCEMISDLCLSHSEIFKITDEAAKFLYMGIFGDTGGFIFPNVTSKTLMIVSELIKYNFNKEEINLSIRENDISFVRVLGYVMQNLIIDGKIAYFQITKEIQDEYQVSPQTCSLVVNFLGVVKGVRAWVIFNEQPQFIRVNLRSKGNINVSLVAQQFKGGGHKNASGANIQNWDEAVAVIEQLKKAVKE